MNLTKDEKLLINNILKYYSMHHLSITSLTYVEVLSIIDKISKDLNAKWTMLEAGVALAVATVTGVAALTNRLHNRMTELDKRLDKVEIRIAEQYVSKTDLNEMLERFERHMIRIENKLDKISLTNY